jgi:probable rRNA maturation factor
MYSIHIASEQNVLRVNRPRLVQLAEATLASERVRAADISIALVDDVRIHEINRQFLGHDYPTDVISFLLESASPVRRSAKNLKPQASSPKPLPRGAGKTLGGEIIISVETAVSMAADYGWRPVHELSLYLVHGLLHLCGYDDLSPNEQRVMRKREVEVLAPWKIVPHYAG